MDERNGFEINGKKFKMSKIDAMRQFHIVRRLGPILGDIIPAAKKFIAGGFKPEQIDTLSIEQKLDAIAPIIQPLMDGFAKLSDKDAEFVLHGLCASAEIFQPDFNTWARISTGSQFMIQTLELPEIMQVAGRVFAYNLTGFFALARQSS